MVSGNAISKYSSGLVIKLVAVTWLITKLICYKLWLAGRLFPLIPVHDSLALLPASLHAVLFIISLVCLLLLLFFSNKKMIAVLLLAELLSCLLDQNRWQPWEYQFIFMLAVFVFIKEEKGIRFSWQLIIAGIFLFSGISKLNSAFIHDVWQSLMLHKWLGMGSVTIWADRAGYALPLIEMTAAVCLLISNTRKQAVWILTLMHLLILLMLGPLGLNINAVIWPWNILMPLLLFALFYDEPFQYRNARVWNRVSILVLVCWWILPFFQLAGYWDKYLSSVLYSGGIEQLFICTSDPAAKKEMAVYMEEFKVIPCSPVLSAYKWGVKEMRSAPYPEERVYRAIINAWRKRYPNTRDRFYIYKPGFAYTVREVQ